MQHLTFLVIRIRQQVRLLVSEDMKLRSSLGDLLHRTAGSSCQLFNISRTFAGPRIVFLTASGWSASAVSPSRLSLYHFSYTLNILFCSDSPWPSATDLPSSERSISLCQSCVKDLSQNWLPTYCKTLQIGSTVVLGLLGIFGTGYLSGSRPG